MQANPEQDAFLPTRRSLLTRLKSWDNHDSWREFFETYWRLIYGVAIKSGLNEAEAEDVVQETMVSVAKQMPDFKYDRAKGTFKSWLRQITRRRIADQLRKRGRAAEQGVAIAIDSLNEGELADISTPATNESDSVWEQEWKTQLAATALARVKQKVKPDQFQAFELCVLKNWPAREVAHALGVSLPNVYWARHKVSGVLKKELQKLEREMV